MPCLVCPTEEASRKYTALFKAALEFLFLPLVILCSISSTSPRFSLADGDGGDGEEGMTQSKGSCNHLFELFNLAKYKSFPKYKSFLCVNSRGTAVDDDEDYIAPSEFTCIIILSSLR